MTKIAQINHQYGGSKWAKVFRGESVDADPSAIIAGETAEQYAQRMRSLCFVPTVAVRNKS